jgi:tetratricopeptide (TPR) repeat protein
VSVLAKSQKSKRKPESAAETLDQLESLGDRVGNWIAENAILVLGAAVLILVVAGGYGFANSRLSDAREKSSAALAAVEGAFLRAMGSSPDAIQVEEPANPETARRVREEYIGRYRALASEYSGTLQSQLASLEAGALEQALGRSEEAIATWQAAIDDSSDRPAVRGLLLQRIAGAHETLGRWEEAAAAHEAASELEGFAIRYLAMADAARCYAEAGDSAKALALFDRLQAEAPGQPLAPAIESRLTELRAIQ